MTLPDFDSRLRDALAIELPSHDLARLDAGVAKRLATRPGPAMRFSRIAIALVALAIAVPLVAVTSAGIRQTEGQFGVTDAKGFQSEIDAAKRVVPLPVGASWPWYVDVPDPDASYDRNGGRSQVERVAFCLWLGSWLHATDVGDAAGLEAARSTLLAVPTWEMYTSPFADQSFRDLLDEIVVGVEANDPSRGRAFFEGNCSVPPGPPST